MRGHDLPPRPFSAADVVVISDEHAWLEYRVRGRFLAVAREGRGVGCLEKASPELPDGSFWQRWSLAQDLARDRRMGTHELDLRTPKGVTLRCYVIPHRVVGVQDLFEMLKECGGELGRPIQWERASSSAVRSWVDNPVPVLAETPLSALKCVKEELIAAEALRRAPPREFTPYGKLAPAPELAVITRWADVRCGLLSRIMMHLEEDLTALDASLQRGHPTERRRDLESERRRYEEAIREARGLRARVRAQRRHSEEFGIYIAGPMSQRDYRMRRLLRAFAPPRQHLQSPTRTAKWSDLPPTSANRLFEVWGAVWMVSELRKLGFRGEGPFSRGIASISSSRWSLRRGEVAVQVDYEPHPEFISLDGAPPLGERVVPAVLWGIDQREVGRASGYVGGAEKCSPDYVITIEGPAGVVFAVGDACLADPVHHTPGAKGFKPSIVANYRRTIFALRGGRMHACDPLGAFVLFPGPTSEWEKCESSAARVDVWLFCPKPTSEDGVAAERFRAFAQYLVGRVSVSQPPGDILPRVG
ncbi:MAG: hypothetical protein H6711_04525 [Myxococcales bacterium]|nr:hypothetical protein [Myxococcales bacterium]